MKILTYIRELLLMVIDTITGLFWLFIRRTMNGYPESLQERLVRFDDFYIAYIKNPSEHIQLLAMELNPKSIRRIHNPTEQVQILAIDANWNYIVDIHNPTPRVLEYMIDTCEDRFSASLLVMHFSDRLSDEQKVYLSLLS